MSLDVDEVAAMLLGCGSPERTKASVLERGRRIETRNMSAELGGFLVGTKNDCKGIPADDGPDAMLDVAVPICALLALRRNRINVRGVQSEGGGGTGALRLGGQPLEQKRRAVRAPMMQDRPEGIDPFS